MHGLTNLKIPLMCWQYINKIAKSNSLLPYVCLSECPSARIEQLGSLWTDFQEI